MFSHQPGARIPRRCGPYPGRDDYVAYLEQYAAGMRIRFGTAVGRVNRAGTGWELDLGGASISTAHVVIATGPDAKPGVDYIEGPNVCFADGSACRPRGAVMPHFLPAHGADCRGAWAGSSTGHTTPASFESQAPPTSSGI
jgi:hypothetical protein